MRLLTDKEINELADKYPLYSQDGKGINAFCSYKFFFPFSSFTWYITECSKDGDYITLFGVTIGASGEGEFGYTTLNELDSLQVRGLQVERDKNFTPAPLVELYKTEPPLQDFLDKWRAIK